MIQILQFHRSLYLATAMGIALVLLLAVQVPWIAIAALPAAFWFVSSLAVSWYVYDASPLSRYDWLAPRMRRHPMRWINLHAGLDQASMALQRLFPASDGRSFDIFDPLEMRAASILEARRVVGATDSSGEQWRALPPQDVVFLVFTAHELRRFEARVRLFRAASEVLAPGGDIAVVEHVRDGLNFLAFGPGFWHFLPAHAWRKTAAAAGLRIREEFSVTPFVRVFLMERAI
jgi:hypothetical protein